MNLKYTKLLRLSQVFVIIYFGGIKMTLIDVLDYYGGPCQFRAQTKMSINNIYNWRDRGFIPIASQIKIEHLTKGALKASFDALVNNDLRR